MAGGPRTRQFVKMLAARYATRAAEEDVAEYRGLTPLENDAVVSMAARSALQLLRSRADFAQAMAEVDPPAADLDAIRARLMARRRA